MSYPCDEPDRPHTSAAEVEHLLRLAMPEAEVTVHDDSAAHAGHAGAREGSHMRVEVTSPRFVGMSRVARHRAVNAALAGPLAKGIHALQISARTPSEAP